jgi:methionyl aminopeptidase
LPSGGFVQEQSEIGDKSAMAITLKTPEDLEHMRVAGRLAAEVLQVVAPYVKPSVSGLQDQRLQIKALYSLRAASLKTVGTVPSR